MRRISTPRVWHAPVDVVVTEVERHVDPNVLFVDEGRVLTSAGAAAGLDLCLHLVRRDHGTAVAAQTARVSVMPLERAGGQAQFVVHEPPVPVGTSLEPVLAWLADNLHTPLTVPLIAAKASMSTRSLTRHFRNQIGITPMQWLSRQRIRRAQQLLEETGRPVQHIGELVGFASPMAFRERFRQVVGVSPRDYRRTFGHAQRLGQAGEGFVAAQVHQPRQRPTARRWSAPP
jgi:transcriptional regulator GlxA family with amidase domain